MRRLEKVYGHHQHSRYLLKLSIISLPRTTQGNSPTAPNPVPILTLNQGQLSRSKRTIEKSNRKTLVGRVVVGLAGYLRLVRFLCGSPGVLFWRGECEAAIMSFSE